MKSKILLAGAIVLALGLLSLPASSQDGEGAVLAGTWYFETVMGPGMVLPSVLVFHSDHTVVASGGIAFGGIPTNPYRYTPFQGVWERTGPHEFTATFYCLRFDGTTGLLVGIARKIDHFWFAGDFDHFVGTMRMNALSCPTPLTCPDPQAAAETDWLPWTPLPGPWSIHATRISGVPY